jgi:hypothetical protein
MPVDYKVVLIPDLYGKSTCSDCHGYGWSHGYRDDEFARIDCEPCEGNGSFREETEILPSEDGSVLQSEELSRDSYGRHIHLTCNGGGVRFFTQCREHYWSCASCKKWGVLSPPEWKLARDTISPLNLFANARGADLLQQLRSTL